MKEILSYMLLASTFLSINAFSASVEFEGTVSRIYPTQGGGIRFQLKDQTKGCSPLTATYHYYEVPASYPAYDEYYALLLAAAHSQKSLSLYADDAACSDNSIYTSPVALLFQNF